MQVKCYGKQVRITFTQEELVDALAERYETVNKGKFVSVDCVAVYSYPDGTVTLVTTHI